MGAAASVEMTSKRSDINAADGSELNEAQGYVLEAVGGGLNLTLDATGTKCIGWGLKGEKSQTWKAERVDENIYTIRNAETNSYLAPLNAYNGAQPLLKASPSKWKTYKGSAEDSFVFESMDFPGQILANTHASSTNGNIICTWQFAPVYYPRMSWKLALPPDADKEKKLKAAHVANVTSTTSTNTSSAKYEDEINRLRAENAELLKSHEGATTDADAELARLRKENSQLRETHDMQVKHLNESVGADENAAELARMQRENAELRKSLASASASTGASASASTLSSDASLLALIKQLQIDVAECRKFHVSGSSTTNGVAQTGSVDRGLGRGTASETLHSGSVLTATGNAANGVGHAGLRGQIDSIRTENALLQQVPSGGSPPSTMLGGAASGGITSSASSLKAELDLLNAENARLRGGGLAASTAVTGTHVTISGSAYQRLTTDIERLKAEIVVLSQRPITCSV